MEETAQNPAQIVPEVEVPRAGTVGLFPAVALVGLGILPFTGLQELVTYDIAGFPAIEVAKLLALLGLAALFGKYWHRGFTAAVHEAADQAQIATTETVKQMHQARYQRERSSKELAAALERLKAADARAKKLAVIAKRSTALARTTIDASADALVITDVNGVVQDISAPTCTLCGVHRLDAIGTPFDELIHLFDPTAETPSQHPVRRLALLAVESTDNVPKLENLLLTTRAGKSRPVLVTSMAITDKEGTVAGAYVKFETADTEGESSTHLSPKRPPTQLDPVTGLQTRDAFNRRADELLRTARQQSTQHSLLFIAPNNLDFTADRHGYRAAEQLLWNVAESCRESVPESGFCYYVAAGRFAVLLPNTSPEEAAEIGGKITEGLNRATLTWEEHSLNMQSAICALPMDSGSPGVGTLLDQAERMLRGARRTGGGRVYTGLPAAIPKDDRFDDFGWVEWLQQRLDAGLGHLLSQEILPADKEQNQRLIECYVRVEDTDGVWIAPNAYLPALQRTGDTGIVDIWVLSQLLKQMQEKPDLTQNYRLISLNISPESISSTDFVSRATERLMGAQAQAKHICFEIQESTVTSLHKQTHDFISSLQKTGAKIAVDQCTGVNLQHILRKWKPALIKIDPSLVRKCETDKLAQAQIRWLVECAKLTGVATVACGVEDESWVTFLKKSGVDYFQGSALNKIGPVML